MLSAWSSLPAGGRQLSRFTLYGSEPFSTDAIAVDDNHHKTDLCHRLQEAFASVPYPGDRIEDISLTEQDEGIAEYFRGTRSLGHAAATLRRHVAALSFFTPQALRYWLPAFMIAELEEPDDADVIGEHLMATFAESGHSLSEYSVAQLRAMEAFIEEYDRRYGEDRKSKSKSKSALRRIQAWLRNASG